MNPSLLYRFLKIYCSVGLWFYFRKWQVEGIHKVPRRGPLIYIANHQNAFLDAILMTCSASRNPYYLARANVFKKSWAAKLLSLIHLKPIYRFRDGFSTLKNNDVVMQNCIDLLKKGEVILMFPEGNHNEPWCIGEFQKGFARMALMYRQQTGDDSIKIVPIGIHYTDHHAFNSRVLLNFGDSLSVSDLASHQQTEREKLQAIVDVSEKALKQLVLDIKPETEYNDRQRHLLYNRKFERDMIRQLLVDREVVEAYPEVRTQVKQKYMGQNLAFPFLLYVYLTHGLQYLWVKRLMNQKIKDPQFISSVKYAIGIFTTPVYYMLITLIFFAVTKNTQLSILFFASLPISLIIATKTLRH